MEIKAQQPLQEKSTQATKPFVVKEGTTLEDVKKHGTKLQIAKFMVHDWDNNNILNAEEAKCFQDKNVKSTLNGNIFQESNQGSKFTPIDIVKLEQVRNQCRKYGINAMTCLELDSIKETTKNGKKYVVVDTKGYTLTLPIENAKTLKLEQGEANVYFNNAKNATLVLKETPYIHKMFFEDSQVEIYCKDNIYDAITDYGNSTLKIVTNDNDDTYKGPNGEEEPLPQGTTVKSTNIFQKYYRKAADWWKRL